MTEELYTYIQDYENVMSKLHELFDTAWACNDNSETRTELSQKCTTFIPYIEQFLYALVEEYQVIIRVNDKLHKGYKNVSKRLFKYEENEEVDLDKLIEELSN